MIKVLQMGMTDNLGGIETYLINYYENIDKNKIQMDFTNIYPNNLCFSEEILKGGSKIYNIPSYYRHPILYVKEVKKIINENNYEIIHCNMNSAAMLWPLIAAKLSKAKIIISHSHNSSSDKGIIKTILHNINRHFIPVFANTYFACSTEAAKWFFSKKLIKNNKVLIISNAIETEKYKFNNEDRKIIRKEFEIEDNAIVIGHVGRFEKQKNHDFIIDIFNELHKRNNNSVLLLIGQGNLQNQIKEKVEKLNLNDSIKFLGKRSDVNKINQAMDVFLFPSLYEGLSISLLEAQMSGLICICAENLSKESVISDNTFLYSLNLKAEEWADEILNKIQRCKRIEELEGMDYQKFDIKKESKRLEEIYVNLINGVNNE